FALEDARALLAAGHEHQLPPAVLLAEVESVAGLSPAGRSGLRRLGRVLAELRRAPDIATGLARYLFALTRIGARLLPEVTTGRGAMGPPNAAEVVRLLAMGRAFDDARRSHTAPVAGGAPREADWAGFLDYMRVTAVLRQEAAGGEEAAAP